MGVTPGAQSGTKADAKTIAEYTLRALKRVVPPAVPGIMFLSGGQSEVEATLNLNAMNKSPNPWHISFSYARALQNTTLKTWAGKDENKVSAQAKLRSVQRPTPRRSWGNMIQQQRRRMQVPWRAC